MTASTRAYGMHYDAGNSSVIAPAKAVGECKWAMLPIETLPARTPLNACWESVDLSTVKKVVSREVEPRENYPLKLWRDGSGRLYIVDGHTRTAIYYELNKPMSVRIMDEKSLSKLSRLTGCVEAHPAMARQDLGKGVWHDPVNTGYIGLDLTAVIPPQDTRSVEGTKLSPKQEYHCSLVAVRKYIDDPTMEHSIVNAVKGYLRNHELRFAGLGDVRYLCRKEDRVTIVAPVQIHGIEEFCAFVQTLIPEYRTPFIHVTLLKSKTTEHGISLNTTDDLHRFCTTLTP